MQLEKWKILELKNKIVMKQLFISIFIIISTLGISAQSVAEQAQKAYDNGDFRYAITLLEGEIKAQKEQGKASAELYYNLGNAYFRVNEIPLALLNYERAQLYDPGDRDIKHNIEYAQTKIEDKILTADNFFLKMWFNGVRDLLPSNSWAKLSIVFFLLFIGSLFLFFFSPKLSLKKAGFYSGVVLFVFLLFTNIFAYTQKKNVENRDTAIIMAGSAPVVSSPNTTSKELFILHAGTKVSITKEDGSWYEIEIDNGSVGWIQKDKLEII